MRRMRSVIGVTSTLVALATVATVRAEDTRAQQVAQAVFDATGGASGWKATRYLRFDFVVETKGEVGMTRSHHWDRTTGRYRLEGQTREGEPFVVVMNVNTRQGRARLGGKELSGKDLTAQLERAHAIWINDTYWLLMPIKLRDPGVVLSWVGEEQRDGVTWDKLALSFGKVGLTPGDRYWVWVDRSSGLPGRWDYILESQPSEGSATRWDWTGWSKHGQVTLASERVNEKDSRRILFPVLDAPTTIPDKVFDSLDPL